MESIDRPASEWPDEPEQRRWAQALKAVSERQRAERGVDEPTRVTVRRGTLWGYYGPIHFRLAGEHAELHDETDLFDQIDAWVAFERPTGPGRLLDRDRAVIEAWRSNLPSLQAVWNEAAGRVFHDVVATTSIRWNWRVDVHEDEEVFPDVPEGVIGIWASERSAGWTPPRRRLLLPELWLEAGGWATWLPEPDGVADAIVYVADKVQDEVMEELCTTWPKCPYHEHPLSIGGEDPAAWVCPDRPNLSVEIGLLTARGRRSEE